ncbi:MAG: L,D-transpeptidase family protein [Desulfarculus sp.]|nr:L,D-transpeptidase family protein [Desulfarculus sp.]
MPRPRLARRLLTWTLALLLLALATPALAVDLVVTPNGWANLEGQAYRCALGRAGIKAGKREGDGATPAGTFPLRRVLYRPDKFPHPPANGLPVSPIAPDDGWCDEAFHPQYNRPVKLPFAASHEELWRADTLYDLIVVVGYNDDPVVPGQGSAIFLHIARPGYAPTAGCLAFSREDLLEIVGELGEGSRVVVLDDR